MRARFIIAWLACTLSSFCTADRNLCGPTVDVVDKRDAPELYIRLGSAATREDTWLLERNLTSHSRLTKRVLPPLCEINDRLGEYVHGYIFTENYDQAYGLTAKVNKADVSMTVQMSFTLKTAFKIGTGNLEGCTVLTIVSNRAVYMGHFWETLSMQTNKQLTENVLNLITGDTPKTYTTGPKLTESLYKDGEVWGFIMTPRAMSYRKGENRKRIGTGRPAAKGKLQYPTRVRKIQETVENMVPGINWAIWDYPITADGIAPPAPAREALFEYDPKADAVGKNWRLFYEGEMHEGRRLTGFGDPNA
ncbi:hypothetical protein MBLNU13_g04210t1 [Cladosporium sp. NU13]